MVLNSELVFPVVVLPIIIIVVVVVSCGFLCSYIRKCHRQKNCPQGRANGEIIRRYSIDLAELSVADMACQRCVRRRLSDSDYHAQSFPVNRNNHTGAQRSASMPHPMRPPPPPPNGHSFFTIPIPDYDIILEHPPAYEDIYGAPNPAQLPNYEVGLDNPALTQDSEIDTDNATEIPIYEDVAIHDDNDNVDNDDMTSL